MSCHRKVSPETDSVVRGERTSSLESLPHARSKSLVVLIVGLLLPWVSLRSDEDDTAERTTPFGSIVRTDSVGRTHDLSRLGRGRVVLEWLNPRCPQSLRHHLTGTMKRLERKYRGSGVRWFGVYSGKSCDSKTVEEFRRQRRIPYPILLDPDGALARFCGARRTPHMFVFSDGVKIYEGAIDNDSRDQRKFRTNYVERALEEFCHGSPVSLKYRRPYGSRVQVSKR